jgi:trehalose 6-phosphate synthase
MLRALRFVLALLVGLGLLTWIAYGVLARTNRRWFEDDVRLRSLLAVESARRTLLAEWSRDSPALNATLADITRDERIMGVAACDPNGERLAATDAFPPAPSCHAIASSGGVDGTRAWKGDMRGGAVHVTIVPVTDGARHVGFVALAHDLSFVARRETTAQHHILIAFAILAAAASLITMGAVRLAWRTWLSELRGALDGRKPAREFQPLVADLRALVQRLVEERELDVRGGPWTAERLRTSLRDHLGGDRVVVVANREPYIHERLADGSINVVHPASGLVTALEPVLKACSGVWVGHGSGSADRETADEAGRIMVPPGENSFALRRVWLSQAEEAGYYYGIANQGLWPLCHLAHVRPTFRAEDWEQYRAVNRKFANAVCDEADSDDPIILVQDYHFALAPKFIRERLPKATILTFWHIPWPNAERFGICPWREEILSGLLGSSILGFHTRQHCNNFIDSVDSFVESRIDREHNAIEQRARRTLIRPYPISIEWPVHWLKDLPSVEACRRQTLAELGLPSNALLGVGVDRLDYTKGIEERLLAVNELLIRYPAFRGRFRFAQLAAPSRTRIEGYRDLNERVERLAESINARWGSNDYQPIILHRAHHEPRTVFRYFRAADLCYVSSLHDGMNLVAKEFVAAREDERGVLILSQFTGAARELPEAFIVNPYDLRQTAEALAAALHMSADEQQYRMRAMRALVADLNVYRWAGRMLIDAAHLRKRERLFERVSRGEFRLGEDAA